MELNDEVYCQSCGAGYPRRRELNVTETATTAEKAKKKSTTPPIQLAERQLGRQIKLIEEAELPADQKGLLVDGLSGVQRLFQTMDQIADPQNPPSKDSAWGKVVSLGKSVRTMTSVLAGVTNPGSGETLAEQAGF